MNFFKSVLEFIFPPVCGICGKVGEGYLCLKCKKDIINSNIYLNRLEIYQNTSYINEHFYIFSYKGIIRKKILQYKFEDMPYLSNTFYEFFINNKKICGFLKKYDIILSVPISKQRENKRGYNQSKIIAKKISKLENIEFDENILFKKKHNKPQSELNRKQRLENVKDVYNVQNRQKIKEKRILLFDDIYTTGATANECAKILKLHGAKSVGILTIAKD